MTVKTLTYIHKLLIENESKLDAERLKVQAAWKKVDEEDSSQYAKLHEEYRVISKAWSEARTALEDFEEKEW